MIAFGVQSEGQVNSSISQKLNDKSDMRNAEKDRGEKAIAILRAECFSCHGEEKTSGLDLRTRESAMRGGKHGASFLSRKANESLIYQYAIRTDGRQMPPAGKLAPVKIAVLKVWLDAGSPWPESRTGLKFWSFQPISRPNVPAKQNPKSPIRNPIDAFILKQLQQKRLKPSPPADKRTLIRRAYYDLIGLPPTPRQVNAFTSDKSSNAFSKVVDSLLASPRYGERWGRHWLDIVHYGDTHGYDKDKRRDNAWHYRDYVIRAFNEDKPYGRFVQEQLAGDKLVPHMPDGVFATGFIAAGPWDYVGNEELREGSVEKAKTKLLDRDDMVSNTMSTFTSMTVHCSRCHDHKFDPIPQQDYYRLQAVFAGVTRGDRPYDDPVNAAKYAELELKRAKIAQLKEQLKLKTDNVNSPTLDSLAREIEALHSRLKKTEEIVYLGVSPTNGYHSGIESKSEVEKWAQVDLGHPVAIESVRLVPARPVDFADTPGFGFPQRFRVCLSNQPDFSISETIGDYSSADFLNPGDSAVSVPAKGKTARYVRILALKLWKRTNDYVFALGELQVESGHRNVAKNAKVTAFDSIESGRWSTKYLVDDSDSRHLFTDTSITANWNHYREVLEIQTVSKELEQSRLTEKQRLIPAELTSELKQARLKLAAVENEISALPPLKKSYAVVPIKPQTIQVLARGDVEQPLEIALPGTLSCLSGHDEIFALPDADDEGSRRAALAQWITDRKNPLTWRSIVNRVWQYHFGRGIVDTPNDFGRNGSLPSHPELLDWLASAFVSDSNSPSTAGNSMNLGQSIKRLHRIIMLSATYQQSSRVDPENARIDADNRLLWRMNSSRLDAEAIRDSVLAISGKMDTSMGGPGFEMFAFKDDHSPIYNYTAYDKINLKSTWRRSVYRFTVRSVGDPFYECLDCADPSINTPIRSTTLTALQALTMLHNPFMVQQSAYFAERLSKERSILAEQIDLAYRLVFGRQTIPDEMRSMILYAKQHGLADMCRILFNTNEFMFVD